MKKIKLRNIILFIIVVSSFLLLVLTQLFGDYTRDNSQNTNNDYTNTNVIAPNVEDTKECHESSELVFYYYKTDNEPFKVNNKFGLYIYSESKDFFDLAAKLVNSNNGEWGYVLIPFNVRDRDYDKWRTVFARLYEKKLIPIIQLHDVDRSDYKKETKEAAEFLNSFVWPIKDRYISVYNEPNDAKFWYGIIDPDEYARILDYTIDAFKSQNDSFFMLNGALNISAPNTGITSCGDLSATNCAAYMDAFTYMSRMDSAVPGIFDKLDGWASHSYPQPNFSGNPHNTGRWSIKAYENELEYLKQDLGVKKELPVFITETGWAHAEGENYNSSYYDVDTISDFFKEAYEDVWLPDDRVVAVTPFTIRFEPPFDHFSWVNKDNVPYKHYEVVKNMKKVKGEPQMLVQDSVSGVTCD